MGSVVIELSLQGFVGTLFQGVPFVVVIIIVVAVGIVGRLGITYSRNHLVGVGRVESYTWGPCTLFFSRGLHVPFGVGIIGRYGCNSYSGVGGFAYPR